MQLSTFVSLVLLAIVASTNAFAPAPRALLPRSVAFMGDDTADSPPFTGTVKWYEPWSCLTLQSQMANATDGMLFSLLLITLTTSFSYPLRFNTMKGFGFIVPDDDSGDVFVHQTAIKAEGFRSLADGERVEVILAVQYCSLRYPILSQQYLSNCAPPLTQFRTETDANGRLRAVQVTGPDGSDVQGAPFRPSSDYGGY